MYSCQEDSVMNNVVICAAQRTGIGSFQGQWSHLTAPDLAAAVIKSIVKNTAITQVDECILGCVLSAAVGQAPARQALLKSGLENSIPCTTVNKVCGSAMKAVALACDSILAGNAEVILAGGMESMSNAPYMIRARQPLKMGHHTLIDHMYYDGLENPADGKLMGHYAERCVKQYGFTREQQDSFAITSVERAKRATEQLCFVNEIVAVDGIKADQQLSKCDVSKVNKLKPAFNHLGGSVTAANSSSISDGAAIILLSSRKAAEKNKLPILAYVRGYTSFAQAPEEFTTAVSGAINKVLKRCHWKIDEVELFEINEAFAVVVLAAMQSLQLRHDQVNIRGGACAIGHPIGASGARVIVTLLHTMIQKEISRGVASVCIGGGEAMAIALELFKTSDGINLKQVDISTDD